MKVVFNLGRLFKGLSKRENLSLSASNNYKDADMKEVIGKIFGDSDTTELTGIPSVDRVFEKYYSAEEMDSFYKTIYRQIYDNNCDEDLLDKIAIEYFGNRIAYREFFAQIDKAAKSFVKLGVKKGDIVSVCMPNTPEAVISFYALNKIGAVASMIHPLSGEQEIKYYLNKVEAKFLIAVDATYEKIINIKDETSIEQMVVVSPSDSMKDGSTIKNVYDKITSLKETIRNTDIVNLKSNICRKLNIDESKFHILPSAVGKKLSLIRKDINNATLVSKIKYGEACMSWADFIEQGNSIDYDVEVPFEPGKLAVLFNTGGTTGDSKMAMHSNETFNVSALQLLDTDKLLERGDSLYSMFPVFHGVGLSSVVHLPLTRGMKIILNPKPTPKNVLKGLLSSGANHWAGIPTLWEPIFKVLKRKRIKLPFVKTLFCGADTIKKFVEDDINQTLSDGDSVARLNNGLGMTETVTAILASNDNCRVSGSIGFPLKGNEVKITKLANRTLEDGTEEIYGTTTECGYDEQGEICVRGPSVFLGYYKDKEATDAVLRKHEDGEIWLHTGDIGTVNKKGIYYYNQRIKRMFVSNGYNIYPTEIEKALESLPMVEKALVVGVPHTTKGTVAKAFVIFRQGYSITDKTSNFLREECKKKLSAWSLPFSFSFEYRKIEDLPKTLYTKTNYLELEKASQEEIIIEDETTTGEGVKVKKFPSRFQ